MHHRAVNPVAVRSCHLSVILTLSPVNTERIYSPISIEDFAISDALCRYVLRFFQRCKLKILFF